MKTLTIIKFDGTYYLCEDNEKKLFAIDKSEMPENVKEGGKIRITDDGTLETSE